jgi:hypothetical protein
MQVIPEEKETSNSSMRAKFFMESCFSKVLATVYFKEIKIGIIKKSSLNLFPS